ncbi:MAG: ROK family protein [Hyphomicrobiaceae bacterium]|nr:ROK family protein [Hyphomicrobiaceae bacterium]
MSDDPYRIGVDLGGTKIEGAVLDRGGAIVARRRIPSPQGDYCATIAAIVSLVASLERECGERCSVGIGMPGSISPATGRVQNANSTWLNGTALDADVARALQREVRFANDANCFALSEATDGAGAGARTVFGIILGTGCGGGIVIDGRLVDGPRGIGGEWGHNPLPWPTADELQIDPCWCGRSGCLETWLSGPAVAADHRREAGQRLTCEAIALAANPALDGTGGANASDDGYADGGRIAARATLARHADRMARAIATVVNLIDPDVIVIGGGLSALAHLYDEVPRLAAPYIFAERATVTVRPPRWGATSGVRGAAWLWGGSG